ncbi:hypothetical protein [Paenibacillus lignilyticus]|uniref:DUF2178 domain-containing protein n=1 Tax=Paenibacillus lignilyticus TaxID=1172615 RepID=A0ABS5CA77_9BACL|nr:hypothetical protein [Paenibacillus lignilyticus]MBP3962886.1 hypothetical protein [Paenibacillus lignilyticus]
MKNGLHVLGYAAYLLVLSTLSFLFYWVIKIWIAMGRFTAADAPPGDIGETEKLFYSYVVPVGYGVMMTLLSFAYRQFLLKSPVSLSALFIIAINLLITVYFLAQFRSFSFS